jgi:hypothetical protein
MKISNKSNKKKKNHLHKYCKTIVNLDNVVEEHIGKREILCQVLHLNLLSYKM